MREVKFRAWDKKYNKMLHVDRLTFGPNRITPALEVGADLIVDPELYILMQYTGLKDKNGVEIYEGDVVDLDGEFIATVEFKQGAFGYVYDSGERDSGFDVNDWGNGAEVIGNIYQNPELLN